MDEKTTRILGLPADAAGQAKELELDRLTATLGSRSAALEVLARRERERVNQESKDERD